MNNNNYTVMISSKEFFYIKLFEVIKFTIVGQFKFFKLVFRFLNFLVLFIFGLLVLIFEKLNKLRSNIFVFENAFKNCSQSEYFKLVSLKDILKVKWIIRTNLKILHNKALFGVYFI